jgi:minor curlin subunit
MKNTSLFMMFTLLGAPGFVTAANSDLANAEYNFAVNELSLSSLNQAAIIGQQGVFNDAQVRQEGSNSCPLFPRMGQATERELINQGVTILPGSIRAVTRMMQVLRKMDTVIARKLSRKGRVIEQILRSTVRRKPQL